jgi:hypothetical protein
MATTAKTEVRMRISALWKCHALFTSVLEAIRRTPGEIILSGRRRYARWTSRLPPAPATRSSDFAYTPYVAPFALRKTTVSVTGSGLRPEARHVAGWAVAQHRHEVSLRPEDSADNSDHRPGHVLLMLAPSRVSASRKTLTV